MNHKRVKAALIAVVAVSLVSVLSVLSNAVSSPVVHAQSVAQSYAADTPLQAGMIVRLGEDKSKVAPVNQATADKAYGVIVRPNDAPLSLSEGDAQQLVYVATTGNYKVLMSDQNGSIKQGEYVVISAIEGIGMKVDTASNYVVGKALENFDANSKSLTQTTVKDTAGHERTVKIGYVRMDVNIGKNPLHKGAVSNVPDFLQKAADAIAGKPVSAVRVYLSVIILIIAGAIVISILYAGIRTSIIALGRNPLARKSIFRNLFRVILLGLTILLIGIFAVYLILKL
jgi:hypothetical protein